MATNHYVDNKTLFKEMCSYKELSKVSVTPVPAYIGLCIMKIATHLSHRPNFSNYSFKEEMIGDGIENCLRYIDNFDPKKSQNPFSYFTQIIFFAFIRRIQKEKKQMYLKYESSRRASILDDNEYVQDSSASSRHDEWSDEHLLKFIEDFEKAHAEKKKKATASKLKSAAI